MRIRNRDNRAALVNLLSRPKYDGVVDAVHYAPDGNVAWVRAYERRGSTWSDHVLLDREALIYRLKSGKRFFAGNRVEFEGGEFEVGPRITLQESAAGPLLTTDHSASDHDSLAPIPVL